MAKKTPLSNVPTDRNMLSYTLRSEGKYPTTRWIAVCEYSDCIREFYGTEWRVVKDKRK